MEVIMLASTVASFHINSYTFDLNPCQFLVKIKKLFTEPADALFLTFHHKCFNVESKMTSCMHHTHTNTHTELADGRVSLTRLFVALSQYE